jgi:hypothetical protein
VNGMSERLDYSAQIAEQFPDLDEDTRERFAAWIGQAVVQARMDEIIRFAQAGMLQQLHSVEQVQGYFMARSVMIAIGLGDQE